MDIEEFRAEVKRVRFELAGINLYTSTSITCTGVEILLNWQNQKFKRFTSTIAKTSVARASSQNALYRSALH